MVTVPALPSIVTVAPSGMMPVASATDVLLEVVADPSSPEHAAGAANLAALERAVDAAGRRLTIDVRDPGPHARVPYANHYLADGAVIVPVAGDAVDPPALARLREVYRDREVVGVPGRVIAFGGGGPHCITQQIPAGVELPV
jgi:agmatine deiminase